MEESFFGMKPQFTEQEQLKCPRCESTNTKFCYYNNYNLSQPRHFCKNCRRYWTKGGSLRNIPVGGGTKKNSKRPSNSKRQVGLDRCPTRKNGTDGTEHRRVPESSSFTSHPSASSLSVHNSGRETDSTRVYGLSGDRDHKMMDMGMGGIGGSFNSLLTSTGEFGSLLEGLNANGSGVETVQMGEFAENYNAYSGLRQGVGRSSELLLHNGNGSDGYLGLQSGNSSYWSGGDGGDDGDGVNGWPDLSIYTPSSTF